MNFITSPYCKLLYFRLQDSLSDDSSYRKIYIKLIVIFIMSMVCIVSKGQAPPSWIPKNQIEPLLGQTMIYYNVCTGEKFIVSGSNKRWAQIAIKNGENVGLRLIGVNPFYKQNIKFEKTNFSWRTSEPENFGWITLQSTNTAENKEGDRDRGPASTSGNEQLIDSKSAIEAEKQKIELKKGQSSILLNKILQDGQEIEKKIQLLSKANNNALSKLLDAFEMIESINSFQKMISVSPCLLKEDYLKEEDNLFKALNKFFPKESLINSGLLTNAFRHEIENYISEIEQNDRTKINLETKISLLEKEANLLSGDISASVQDYAQSLNNLLEKTSNAYNTSENIEDLKSKLNGKEGESISRICQRLFENKKHFDTPILQYPFIPDRNANQVIIKAMATRNDDSSEITLVEAALPIVNNLQVDFTIGGLYTTLADRLYVVRTLSASTTDGSDTYSIEKNKNLGGFILATQAHAIWQKTPSFGWGANVGIGVDLLNDQRARYLMGVSLKIGGISDNLLISTGVAFGNVKRLSNEFIEGQSYTQKIDPKTYDKFNIGPYLSLSYILGSKKIK